MRHEAADLRYATPLLPPAIRHVGGWLAEPLGHHGLRQAGRLALGPTTSLAAMTWCGAAQADVIAPGSTFSVTATNSRLATPRQP
jgi:hypothetical protein